MRHSILKQPEQMGGFTDLFILGIDKAANGASDFTGTTSQTINLDLLQIGDLVGFPIFHLDVVTPFAGSGLSAATASLGVTGAGTTFLTTANILAAGAQQFDPVAATVPYPCPTSGTKYLTVDLATTGCNLSALTAGELWIYVSIFRKADRLTMREA